MKRKTSPIPTKVYKYGLLAPVENVKLVDHAFYLGGKFYNKLIEIERTSRNEYRQERARRFPNHDKVEKLVATLSDQKKKLSEIIKASKIATKSRNVPPELATEYKTLAAAYKSAKLRQDAEREQCKKDRDFSAWTLTHNEKKNALVADARKNSGLMWGTYNAIAASVQQAGASAILDPEFKSYRGEGRIVVQIQGGIYLAELGSDTQLQINLPNLNESLTRGEWRQSSRTIVKMRIGSDKHKKPIWATFPAVFHRPLPSDARIMSATITRRRLGVFQSSGRYEYHLCISCESTMFDNEAVRPRLQDPTQQREVREHRGTSTINFGWRQFDQGKDKRLRIAMTNNEVTGLEPLWLPREIILGLQKCENLRSIIDMKFNEVRALLTTWLTPHKQDCPAWLAESLQFLHTWKQPDKLDRVVANWGSGMRFPADADIYPVLAEWRTKHRHLSEWMMRQRRKSYNHRDDYYLKTAARLAQSSSRMVIENFTISKVAVKPGPEVEKTGGNEARHNRTLAAVSELRSALIHACSKHHCPMDITPAVNNTRRCNVCGKLLDWDPAIKVDRQCPECSNWDQDVNATDNTNDKVASGDVVTMVVPAKTSENGEFEAGTISTFGSARKRLHNLEKTLTIQE